MGEAQSRAPVLPEDPAERLAALQAMQIEGASMDVLTSLAAQVPSAIDLEPLFASVDGTPTAAAATEASAWAAATAAHLQLLAGLIQRLDATRLGLEALAALAPEPGSSGGGMPDGPPGSVHIEEMDTDAPSTALPTSLVLAAALYASDAALARPWATGAVASAAQQLLAVLAAQLPPEAAAAHQGDSGSGGLLQEVSTTRSASSQQQQQQEGTPPGVQRLLALALPGALQHLRPVAAAKVEHGRHKTARLETYTGPGDFQRCCAAGQLAWLLRALGGRRLSAATPAVLQLVLTLAEDPFPPAQATALWALQHLGAAGDATALRPHSHLLLPATQRALAGCSDAAWPAAAAAAIAVAAGLEGGNPYAQPYHDVMRVLLDEAELGAHRPERAEAWLAAAPALLPRLGLQLVCHFGRLMPLLLGWALAPQQRVRRAALAALLATVRLAWPRMGAHAPVVWRVLCRVHWEELRSRARLPAEGSAEAARAVAAAAEDVALALWCAAGTEFQVQLMTSQGGGGGSSSEAGLLQAVMERLEAAVPPEQAAAAEAAAAGGQRPLIEAL